MRLDKFLKVSRIIKRRTVAKDAADADRILVNGKTAKAGTDVKVGDSIKVRFGSSELEVRVLELKDTTRKEEAESMYEIIQ